MIPIDFESPKVRSALRFMIYGVMAAIALVATIFLVLAAQGYDIDRKTGQIIQNGLVLVDSGPVSAGVFVNGEYDNDDTPSRLPLPAGTYEIALLRDGYRPWSKTLNLEGAAVEWLYYPKLWPNEIVPAPINALPTIAATSQGPNKQFLAVQLQSNVPTFQVLDVDKLDDSPLESVTIPSGAITPAPDGSFGTFSIVEWSQDGAFFLVQHETADRLEYIVFEHKNPQNARNLTSQAQVAFTQPHFAGSSNTDFFILVDGNVQRFNSENSNLDEPVARGVNFYQVKGDDTQVVVRTNADTKQSTLTLVRGDASVEVATVPANDKYEFGLESFDGDEYFAYFNADTNTTTIIKNPFDQAKTGQGIEPYRVIELGGVNALGFSPNSRFLSLQSGNNFVVYDFDKDTHYSFTIHEPLIPDIPASWMDGHRLQYIEADGGIHAIEFDGTNHQEIGKSLAALGFFFDRSFEYLYTFRGAQDRPGLILEQASLIVKPPETTGQQ